MLKYIDSINVEKLVDSDGFRNTMARRISDLTLYYLSKDIKAAPNLITTADVLRATVLADANLAFNDMLLETGKQYADFIGAFKDIGVKYVSPMDGVINDLAKSIDRIRASSLSDADKEFLIDLISNIVNKYKVIKDAYSGGLF